jgi:hypothetical protein
MNRVPRRVTPDRLDPERVAYWYFRLNGFFQIENFVVHPERRGSQRTDADLLAVRFPHRAERLFDDPNDVMADDDHRLSLSQNLIDVLIAHCGGKEERTLHFERPLDRARSAERPPRAGGDRLLCAEPHR